MQVTVSQSLVEAEALSALSTSFAEAAADLPKEAKEEEDDFMWEEDDEFDDDDGDEFEDDSGGDEYEDDVYDDLEDDDDVDL